jgi:signal transduction histidine kinase
MRTAADLHDELFPLLTAAKWQMDAIQGGNEEEKSSITTSIQYIDTDAARLREIARDLMPVALSTYGLQAALEDFFSIVQKAARIKITFNYKVQSTFTDDQKINCYRIIQEIMQNTIKHAAASQLLISINETKDVVKVICEDNGKGFNYDSMLQKSSGFGLKNIKNRADIISNNFNVLCVPGKGTQYSFDISLK